MAKKASVQAHSGAPTIFVDGRPIPAFSLFGPVPVVEKFARKETGVHLFQFVTDMGWTGPTQYDYTSVDEKIDRVASADDHALIILQVDLNAPTWWNELHPTDLTVYRDGDTELNDRSALQSYASQAWIDEASSALASLVVNTRSTRGDLVIGYSLGVGFAGEWHKDLAQEGLPWDYSEIMRLRFVRWLRTRYGNDLEALRSAWGDTAATFDTVQIPTPARHLSGDVYLFRDPSKSGATIDYFLFRSELVIDDAIHFCEVVKEAGRGECLAGLVSIGYLMDEMPGAFFSEERFRNYDKSMTQNWSQSALSRLLKSAAVDFVGGWTCNLFRSVGGDASSVTVPDSITLHGKLYVSEFDARTHLAGDRLGIAATERDAIEVNRRDFLNVWLRGAGKCAANLGPGTWHWPNVPLRDWYDSAGLVSDMAFTQRLAESTLQLDRTPWAEIAVVVDEESQAYHHIGANLMYPLTTKLKTYELARIGAPYHVYLLDDVLSNPDIPEYKLYLVLNAFHLDDRRREAVRRRLYRDHKVIVWFYAPGISNGRSLSGANISDILGMDVELDDEQWGLNVTVTEYAHPITAGLETACTFGTDNLIGPIVMGRDRDAQVLGRLYYSNGRGEDGFYIKEGPTHTNVWIGAPMLPWRIIRNCAQYAGAHVFDSAGDVLYANRNLLAIHTIRGGSRLLSLPAPASVTDVYDHRVIASDVESFTVDIPAFTTKLYFYGSADRAMALASLT